MKFLLIFLPIFLHAITFKVATYNVENLFDMHFSGKEYIEYIPNSKFGWNKYAYETKLQNISKVLYDLNADIVALEEIESKKALLDLRDTLKRKGVYYRYFAIANKKDTTVKVALLSKFKITKQKDITVTYSNKYRDILEAHLTIDGYPLILFVNHWKSKSGTEKERIKSAKVLRKRLEKLPEESEYIVLGDFNSNYNEYITFMHNKKLNNTNGITGINQILKTVKNGKLVTYDELKNSCGYLYNLWMELPKYLRYSYLYKGEKDTIDNIIIPCTLADDKKIEYIKNSFNVFKKKYLFKHSQIFRWQRRYGYGKFTLEGYSDHLPIYAYFTTDKEHIVFNKKKEQPKYENISIADLYKTDVKLPATVKNVVVIYRDRYGVVVKRKNDRAVYIYGYNKILKKKNLYDITIDKIKSYNGNLEIYGLRDVEKKDKKLKSIKNLLLIYKSGIILSDRKYLNEVIYRLKGIYEKGYLYYDTKKKIRLYNKIKRFHLQDGKKITLRNVRLVLYKNEPEIIIYYKRQIK